MLNGVYQNAASMSGLESWNNAIAQNLSQSSAPGYKKAQLAFEGQEHGKVGYQGNFDKTLYKASIATTAHNKIDFTPGNLTITEDPLELAIEGEGFFEIMTPQGDFVYTRDGQLRLNDLGELVSKQGFHVMSDERLLIQTIPDGGEIKISQDGIVSQNGQEIAILGLRRIDDTSVLRRAHGGFAIPEDSEVMALLGEVKVRQGALEKSNVSPTSEMINMINVSRAFQLNQQVIRARDDLLAKAIQNLGGR